ADKAHLLDGRKSFDYQRCEIGLARSRSAETCAVARGLDDRLDDFRRGVAEDERPPRADLVRVAGCLSDAAVRACAWDQEARGPAHGAEAADGRVDSAGDELLGTLLQGAGLRKSAGHKDRCSLFAFRCSFSERTEEFIRTSAKNCVGEI